ncbi:MAG: LysE family translocator [Rubellimicrobium sp.]|nr:LysE family translocator [Rubellimicrobium sp.]
MTIDLLLPLVLFAFVTSITPGPNNLMLMASGANFGLRRTVPHMLGVAIGFVAMVIGIGLGIAALFELYPASRVALMACSVVYLLYLAWKIATAAPRDKGAGAGRPLTFLQAAAFQWVNPKAWAMALSAVTVYAEGPSLESVVFVAVVFGLVNLPSVGVWVILGREMQRILTSPARLRAFNWTMAALLVTSLAALVEIGSGRRLKFVQISASGLAASGGLCPPGG